MDKVLMKRTTILVPAETLSRIKILADKRHWSVNKWVSVTLQRESKPRI